MRNKLKDAPATYLKTFSDFFFFCSPYISTRRLWTHPVYIPNSQRRYPPTGKMSTYLLSLWRKIIMMKIIKIKSLEHLSSTKIMNQMVYHITGKVTEMISTIETWKMNMSWLFYQICCLSIWKGELILISLIREWL